MNISVHGLPTDTEVALTGSLIGQLMIVDQQFAPYFGHAPYKVRVQIPGTLDPGYYELIATAKTPSGQLFNSTPVKIYVELDKGVSYRELRAQHGFRGLKYRGQTFSPAPVAITLDGKVVSIESAPGLVCVSMNNAVAVVDNKCKGVVVGDGITSIRATFEGMEIEVPVTASLTMRGDYSGDKKIDTVDIEYLRRFIGKPSSVPVDDRDLNSDGKIDALDLRILTTLCSKPRCASE